MGTLSRFHWSYHLHPWKYPATHVDLASQAWLYKSHLLQTFPINVLWSALLNFTNYAHNSWKIHFYKAPRIFERMNLKWLRQRPRDLYQCRAEDDWNSRFHLVSFKCLCRNSAKRLKYYSEQPSKYLLKKRDKLQMLLGESEGSLIKETKNIMKGKINGRRIKQEW